MEERKATIFDYNRMCNSQPNTVSCESCPLCRKKDPSKLCTDILLESPYEYNEIILKWCDEHPIETRQSEFRKQYPNASIDNETGVLALCPKRIDTNYKVILDCPTLDCMDCRERYWFKAIKDEPTVERKATIFDYVRMHEVEKPRYSLQILSTPYTCNEIILKWCDEHPIKTRQSEFLKRYPKARIDSVTGVIKICPRYMEGSNESISKCLYTPCWKCLEKYWGEEIKDEQDEVTFTLHTQITKKE